MIENELKDLIQVLIKCFKSFFLLNLLIFVFELKRNERSNSKRRVSQENRDKNGSLDVNSNLIRSNKRKNC